MTPVLQQSFKEPSQFFRDDMSFVSPDLGFCLGFDLDSCTGTRGQAVRAFETKLQTEQLSINILFLTADTLI